MKKKALCTHEGEGDHEVGKKKKKKEFPYTSIDGNGKRAERSGNWFEQLQLLIRKLRGMVHSDVWGRSSKNVDHSKSKPTFSHAN